MPHFIICKWFQYSGINSHLNYDSIYDNGGGSQMPLFPATGRRSSSHWITPRSSEYWEYLLVLQNFKISSGSEREA